MCGDGDVSRRAIDGVVYQSLGTCSQQIMPSKKVMHTVKAQRIVPAKEIHCESGGEMPNG
jgi:hypothetical protein